MDLPRDFGLAARRDLHRVAGEFYRVARHDFEFQRGGDHRHRLAVHLRLRRDDHVELRDGSREIRSEYSAARVGALRLGALQDPQITHRAGNRLRHFADELGALFAADAVIDDVFEALREPHLRRGHFNGDG